MENVDLDEIKALQKSGADLTEAFLQKALEKLSRSNRGLSDIKFHSILINVTTKNFFDAFVIPSFDDVVQIVRNAGKKTLKEVRQVTNEKLSTKILRQFGFDLAMLLPAILIIALEYRTAS